MPPSSAAARVRYTNITHAPSWTPDAVGLALIDAIRWVRRYGGPAGGRGFTRIGGLEFTATLDDHLEEGWGLPEVAGDDEVEAKALILPPSPAQVTRFISVLEWPAVYLCPEHHGSARMVGLWATCKARRFPFDKALAGRMARGHAYRLRDRGLSIISQGLDRDRVPLTAD